MEMCASYWAGFCSHQATLSQERWRDAARINGSDRVYVTHVIVERMRAMAARTL